MVRTMFQWCKEHKVSPEGIDQFIKTPMALATTEGIPFKGDKSSSAKFFRKHVPETFSVGKLETNIEAIVVDAMFMLRTKPLPSHTTFRSFADFLFHNWVLYNIRWSFNTASEIHIIFDVQNSPVKTPKEIEQRRRDKSHITSSVIQLSDIDDDTPMPKGWQDFINNRANRKALVIYLTSAFCNIAAATLTSDETLFITSGLDSKPTMQVRNGVAGVCLDYTSNHIEADTLVWLHAVKSSKKVILIYSPDTDVYHIGLGIINQYSNKKFYVQLKPKSVGAEFLDLEVLLAQLSKNINLKEIAKEKLGNILQVLFICTGCDYVSFFKNHGKVSFYNAFFDYSNFISGNQYLPGCLDEINGMNEENGFLSFVRLVGCEYFKKVATQLNRQVQDRRADTLYFQCLSTSENDHVKVHALWLEKIREAVGFVAENEDWYLPSLDALEYHWKRVCWVGNIWINAMECFIDFPNVLDHGWEMDNSDNLSVVWDTERNFSRCDNLIRLWTRGCRCKKGCQRACGCRRGSRPCGPGCLCIGTCSNAPSDATIPSLKLAIVSDDPSQMDSSNIIHQEREQDLLTDDEDIDNINTTADD